jgi:hypothetical protein
MSDFCPNFQAIILAVEDKKILIARTRCKMWTCPYCAVVNQKKWRARIIEHIETSNESWTWFTLTAHSKKRGKASLDNLRRAWDTLMKRMKRMYGKFQYCRVYERHKDGSYHLHAIASFHFGDIKERRAKVDGTRTKYSVWLKRNATELKLGYYTHADDIERNHSGYIASYVTKYMTKLSDTAYGEFGRIRRIQVSQGWTKWKADNQKMWEVSSGVFEMDVLDAASDGYRYVDIATGEVLSYDNFIEHVVYPIEFDAQYKGWITSNNRMSDDN